MVDRRFTELELREMLEGAVGYRDDIVGSRYVIDARHRRKRWEIIVEPDAVGKRLVVVTAYPLGRLRT
jgi:hypothetical protein